MARMVKQMAAFEDSFLSRHLDQERVVNKLINMPLLMQLKA